MLRIIYSDIEVTDVILSMLRLFIRRIEVGERSVKYSRHSEQKIRIIYRDIGDADSAMWEDEEKPRILPPISESICQTA